MHTFLTANTINNGRLSSAQFKRRQLPTSTALGASWTVRSLFYDNLNSNVDDRKPGRSSPGVRKVISWDLPVSIEDKQNKQNTKCPREESNWVHTGHESDASR
jgi:hypothetical protein